VQAAICEGRLDGGRLESWRKISAELRHLQVMQDARAAAEQKRKWRIIHRAMRHMPDKRR
jgi:ribosome biogenesis GTPase